MNKEKKMKRCYKKIEKNILKKTDKIKTNVKYI